MKQSILNVCQRLHQWHLWANCILKQSQRAWIHSLNRYSKTCQSERMHLFNLRGSTESWQSHIPATVLHFVIGLHQFFPVTTAKGWFILKRGKVAVRGSHWGTCSMTGTKPSPSDWDRHPRSPMGWIFSRRPMAVCSGIGRVNSSWGTGVFSFLIFHFLPPTPPLSFKCSNCFCWAEEEQRSKVASCQSALFSVSVEMRGLGTYTFRKAILNCCWRTSLEKSSKYV